MALKDFVNWGSDKPVSECKAGSCKAGSCVGDKKSKKNLKNKKLES